jgi:transposase InsO family protein
VQFALWAKREYELTTPDSAKRLGLSSATLRSWLQGWEKDGLALTERGRPTRDSDAETRLAVTALFDLFGPGIGVPTLQYLFGSMPRRELDDMIRRYRETHFDGKRVTVHALSWHHAGAVWAMDYTAPPSLIEGRYRTILAVRDLASGRLLCAVPSEHDDAETTIDALRALFLEHGPPLAIKSDNGPHFVAEAVQRFLAESRVAHLRSPFHMPTYNGSIEAGIGALKIRAHFEAARHDRPGEWTLDDVEAARLRGNELGLPNGAGAGPPDRAWAARVPVAEETRAQLAGLVRQYVLEELQSRGYQEGAPFGADVRLSVERAAVARALCELGFVVYRRRLVSLPINPGLRSRIA